MINVRFYGHELHACGWVRGVVPASEINVQFEDVRVDVKTDILYCDFPRTQIMVFQRQSTPGVLEKMRHAKSKGIVCVYDIDDDFFDIPPEFEKPYAYYATPEVRACILEFIKQADAVVVSTPELEAQLAERAPKQRYFVVKNCLDLGMWEPSFMRRVGRKQDFVTLGYHASGSHRMDIPLLKEVLPALMRAYPALRLHFVGWIGWKEVPELDAFKERISVDQWVEISSLPLAISDFDVAIAPLIACPYNAAKSNIKYLELASEAIPVVASPMPCYTRTITHRVNGFIAENSPSDYWRFTEDGVALLLIGFRDLKITKDHDHVYACGVK